MKLTALIWVLALAGAASACNSGPPINCSRGEHVDDMLGSETFGRCVPNEPEASESAAGLVGSAGEGGCADGADAGCDP